jgi:hypothetical protein
MSPRRLVAAALGVTLMAACSTAVPYGTDPGKPSAATAARIDWNRVIELLRSGRVMTVVQQHDLTVTLTTGDDKRYVAKEPTLDAILGAITLHAPNAQSIVVATE